MPKVSVIIPTYNRAHVLREAIDSVLSQKYSDLELLVVDDGSTDHTKEVVSSYTSKLAYIYQEHQGVSAARNRGIKHTKGDYLAFLDSDDLWLPDKLSTQMRFMEDHPEIHICYTEERWIRRGVRVNPMKKHRKYSGMIFEHCLPLCIVSPSSVLIARSLLEEIGVFDEELKVCEDYDLWLRISARYPIYLLDTPLIIKRGGHDDQLSKAMNGQDRFRIKALVKLLESDSLPPHQRELAGGELKRKCEIYGKGCIKRGKKEEGEEILALAGRYKP
ncbi:MAG: glycosyltransferase [Deltaproteobacteria bacterium]|nr:glycosyltransferase [Deltaproteobacteria bacterium]